MCDKCDTIRLEEQRSSNYRSRNTVYFCEARSERMHGILRISLSKKLMSGIQIRNLSRSFGLNLKLLSVYSISVL